MYQATFDEDWPNYFNTLENSLKERVAKKIQKILEAPEKRHLKQRVNFFIGEVGQYRIVEWCRPSIRKKHSQNESMTYRTNPERRKIRNKKKPGKISKITKPIKHI